MGALRRPGSADRRDHTRSGLPRPTARGRPSRMAPRSCAGRGGRGYL